MTFTSQDQALILKTKKSIENKILSIMAERWAREYVLPWSDVILTGGAIASLLQEETPNDWDFYFTTENAMKEFSSHLMLHKDSIKKIDDKYNQSIGVNGLMITSNAITMEDNSSFITMMYGPVEHIRKSFDYLHCTPYFSIKDRKLYISENQFKSCRNRKLVVNNPNQIKIYRTEKFLSRGYKHEDSGYSWNP